MNLAIIGTGKVGGTLGRRWARGGHSVVFGSRHPESQEVRNLLDQAGESARAESPADAAASAEVVVLATPWRATEGVVRSLGDLDGKIVVDCTNARTPDRSGLAFGGDTSAGEQVAAWVPGARVVKAFNTTGSAVMADPVYGDVRAAMLICGDDAGAKGVVATLAEELGFEAIDAGPLTHARYLEPLAMVWISLAYQQGHGPNFAFAIMRR